MKIIVVGCGKVGAAVTAQLSREGHDIAVIDVNTGVLTDISNNYDVMGVIGNGASHAVQLEAGIEKADLLVAATDSDELNLLCCLIAKKAGGCSTIARVRNPVYNGEVGFIKEELGLSLTVNPEYAAATEAARVLRFPSAVQIETFAKGKVEIVKVRIPENSVLDGCPLAQIHKRTGTDVLICTVERGDQVEIPNGAFVLRTGDVISIVASRENTRDFVARIGLKSRRVRDCMIIGGGTIAFYLAQQLLDSGIRVKIIEKDRDRCEMLSDQLPKATIINADGADQNILMEEGIKECESFVTLTGLDEENLFLSMFAQHSSKAKVITKVDRLAFDEIIKRLDLGTLLHPKNITADNIVRYVRALQNSYGSNMESLYKIIDDKVEALEFIVGKDSPIVGIPLSELKVKPNVLIACISRGERIIIPNGTTQINAGDSVVVVTSHLGCRDIEDILK
ncbi:MAG TPA: Trk system potassium transporter TrkA [Lachnospiraceae bacterium]|nr:Trk system potassium transporter TrkA [Lachnospiraceae bacterium]